MTLLDAPRSLLAAGQRMTLEEFLSLRDHSGFELINGIIRERKMAAGEAYVCGRVHFILSAFNERVRLGWVYPKETVYRCFPGDNFRKLDVSFIRADRHPAEPYFDRDLDIVPDLAVEVLSPNNTQREVREKLRDYFGVGVKRVWVVDPIDRLVRIYHKPTEPRTCAGQDELRDDVLPGFVCRTSELFPPSGENAPLASPSTS